jgi:hypothetical protein
LELSSKAGIKTAIADSLSDKRWITGNNVKRAWGIMADILLLKNVLPLILLYATDVNSLEAGQKSVD